MKTIKELEAEDPVYNDIWKAGEKSGYLKALEDVKEVIDEFVREYNKIKKIEYDNSEYDRGFFNAIKQLLEELKARINGK